MGVPLADSGEVSVGISEIRLPYVNHSLNSPKGGYIRDSIRACVIGTRNIFNLEPQALNLKPGKNSSLGTGILNVKPRARKW